MLPDQDVLEDERVDEQQQERVEERPEKAEDGAAIARFELARDQTLNEPAVADQLGEMTKHPVTTGF